MSELNKSQQNILAAVDRRPVDIYDLQDFLQLQDGVEVFLAPLVATCQRLHDLGLLWWQYLDDEIDITPAGRAALAASQEQEG